MNEELNKAEAGVPGMNSQFAVFLPLGSCNLKTQELMENSELSSINTICGDCMARDGGKKAKDSSSLHKTYNLMYVAHINNKILIRKRTAI